MNANILRLSRSALLLLLIAATAISFAWLVVGSRVLNPLDYSWFTPDSATGHLGWLFLRQQDHLTWPLATASKLAFPLGEPIAYLDSVPIVAICLWPFRHILPDTFQYIGPIFAVAVSLQLYFGYRISSRLSGGDPWISLLGGLLFMTAPSFLVRAISHFPLTNHWLILAALNLYLAVRSDAPKKLVVCACVLSFLAGGINPYLTLMALIVLAAAAVDLFLKKDGSLASAGAMLILPAVSAIFSLALFGFIRPGASAYAGTGYGYFSMNLLSPIDPEMFPSLLLPKQQTGAGQYEGYNYLGLGVLLLAFVSIVRKPTLAFKAVESRWAVLLLVVCLSTLLALSTKIYIGSRLVLALDVPPEIERLLSSFRASGRLFWPAVYIFILCTIAASLKAFGKRAIVVLTFAIVIQSFDLQSLYGYIRQLHSETSSRAFTDSPAWNAVGEANRHLVVVPPWQCNSRESPGGDLGFWTFGKLAARHDMTINSYYAGRTGPKELDYFCNVQPRDIRRDGLRKDTAYVFAKPALVFGLNLNDQFCRSVDGVTLCTADDSKTGVDRSVVDSLPLLRAERPLMISDQDASEFLFGFGWSFNEPWGRWTSDTEASLNFRIDKGRKDTDLALRLTVKPFSVAGKPQRLQLFANDTEFDRFVINDTTDLAISIPAAAVDPYGTVRIVLKMPDAVSPPSVGINADTRKLGVGLIGISMETR